LVISPYSSVFHDFDTPLGNLGAFRGCLPAKQFLAGRDQC
jgi:hypothetical protein